MRTDVGSLSRPPYHEKEPTPASRRATPSERLRAEVDEVFAGGADLATAVEQVARIGARLLLLQTALEAEATEFLGRERYAGAADSPEAREGSRNGYCETARGLHAQRDSLLAQRDSLLAQRAASALNATPCTTNWARCTRRWVLCPPPTPPAPRRPAAGER